MLNKIDPYYKLLKEVSTLDEDLLKYVMGDFGIGLKDLSGFLDLKHPEIYSIFEELSVSSDKCLVEKCLDLINLVKYAKSKNFLKSARIHDDEVSSAFKDKLLNKMSTIRLLKSKAKRQELRLLRTSKAIDLSYIYCQERFWLDYEDSFSCYKRHSSSYKKTIDSLCLRKEFYLNLGYSILAEEVEKDIISISELNQTYHGYHQIKSVAAAVILAKILGFSFGSNGISLDLHSSSIYRPVLAPIHEVIKFASVELNEILSNLESFPGIDNRPLFDFLVALVPVFVDASCKTEPATSALNFLSKNGFKSVVLLGEKNKTFYFINMFS